MQHADRERLAADRADVAKSQRFFRFQHHVAGAVPVKVVFAFIRIEFHGAEKTAVQIALVFAPGRGAQGRKHARIAGAARKQIGLAPKVGPGMRV